MPEADQTLLILVLGTTTQADAAPPLHFIGGTALLINKADWEPLLGATAKRNTLRLSKIIHHCLVLVNRFFVNF